VELEPSGQILRKFGGKAQVPEIVRHFFYAMFQLLPNGDVVLANWHGHCPGFGHCGVQLLGFNFAVKIVWTWSKPYLISSLLGVLALDGSDACKLRDERDEVIRRFDTSSE
jgi:hypothetical protein